jgi:branched-chain amino acid transport system permease protein
VFFIRYVDNSIFASANSFTPLIMSVIGGLGTVLGPIIGAVILISTQQLLALPSITDALQSALGGFFPGVADVGPPISLIIIGVVLVLIVIFMPKGVISLYDKFNPPKEKEEKQKEKKLEENKQ